MKIGKRIRQARVAAGMSQDEAIAALAQRGVKLSKGGLSKYERDGSFPKQTMLCELADVFGVTANYFLEQHQSNVQWLAFRKSDRLTRAAAERIKTLAEAHVESFMMLRHALEPNRVCSRTAAWKVTTPEEVELAAAGLRDAWQLGSQPIESVTASIEDAGGIVVEIHDDSVLFDGLSGWGADGTPIIVANASVPDDRRRFSLAHELGHLYMDLSDAAPNLEERLAHRFAAAFLVPASRVKQELGETRRRLDLRELAALKLKYGLSMQAWIFRAADVGVIQHAHARTLFSAFGAKGWKKVEPVTFTGREHATRLMQLAVRAVAEGLLTTDQAERICPGSSADMEEGYLQLVPELGLVNLAADERARLLERAAALMKDDYAADGALTGFDALEKEGGLGDD